MNALTEAWWVWPLLLFGVAFLIGVVAVMAGVGGGVLFVPVVGGFFPFHVDFVRAAGLLLAMSSSLAAAPGLLRGGLADVRLALPAALVASVTSIIGAMIGLALPPWAVHVCLGITILAICGLMIRTRRIDRPAASEPDAWGRWLGLGGTYREESTGRDVTWTTRRTTWGLALFAGIGLASGMFGIGAGWANVPALNLVLGVPLKVAVGTSVFIMSITGASAAWMYLNRGCVIPLIVVPSMLGIMLGSLLGGRLLKGARPAAVRWVVIGVMAFAGLRSLARGFGI